MSDDMFTLRLVNGATGTRALPGRFLEPADASDKAEACLLSLGVPGASYVELRLNGDPEPHTCIFYLEDGTFGVWNTDEARWPIFYSGDGGEGLMLEGNPFEDDDSFQADDEGEDDGLGDED